jgi:hypothetical protein
VSVLAFRPEVKASEDWLTLTEGAELLSVAAATLRLAAKRDIVSGAVVGVGQ